MWWFDNACIAKDLPVRLVNTSFILHNYHFVVVVLVRTLKICSPSNYMIQYHPLQSLGTIICLIPLSSPGNKTPPQNLGEGVPRWIKFTIRDISVSGIRGDEWILGFLLPGLHWRTNVFIPSCWEYQLLTAHSCVPHWALLSAIGKCITQSYVLSLRWPLCNEWMMWGCRVLGPLSPLGQLGKVLLL